MKVRRATVGNPHGQFIHQLYFDDYSPFSLLLLQVSQV
jgi:hypothetical protein